MHLVSEASIEAIRSSAGEARTDGERIELASEPEPPPLGVTKGGRTVSPKKNATSSAERGWTQMPEGSGDRKSVRSRLFCLEDEKRPGGLAYPSMRLSASSCCCSRQLSHASKTVCTAAGSVSCRFGQRFLADGRPVRSKDMMPD
jgi:hypothetical protein